MSVKDKSFVILGAYGGIGSAVCEMLIDNGAKLYLIGHDKEKITAMGDKFNMPFEAIDAVEVSGVIQAFKNATEKFGQLDGAVNCIGSIKLKPAHLITEKEWTDTININLTTAFSTVKAASSTMLSSGGSVVLMSTAATMVGLPNHEAISAAKSGINGLMLSAAATYAANKLRFNCIAPGLVDTPLSENITKNPKALEISLATHPLGRVGQPSDVANMVCFLLDPENDWITGQIIAVDGGLSSLKKVGS